RPLLDHALQVPADRGEGSVQQILAHLDQRHLEPGLREHVGDAVAHGSAAHDGDALHVGREPALQRAAHLGRHARQASSTLIATAFPPPRQSVARPFFLARAFSAWVSVTGPRAPPAPPRRPTPTPPPSTPPPPP